MAVFFIASLGMGVATPCCRKLRLPESMRRGVLQWVRSTPIATPGISEDVYDGLHVAIGTHKRCSFLDFLMGLSHSWHTGLRTMQLAIAVFAVFTVFTGIGQLVKERGNRCQLPRL